MNVFLFMLSHVVALTIGFVLDLFIGDPQDWPHLVRFYGNCISKTEKRLRGLFPNVPEAGKYGGILLVEYVLLVAFALNWSVLWVSYHIHWVVGILVEGILCWQCLAMKSLKEESKKVYTALETGTLEDAQYAVSMIVGRDTKRLDKAGVTKAAVETVAENTGDGIIAPMFWIFLLGSMGGCLYKAINTMDSMIGYKNEKYLYWGRAAAKLDDVVNWIPARLSGVLLTLSAYVNGMDGANSWRIFLRDRRNHASPNSAHGEAAVAGALHLQLAGDAWYFGELHKKPFIGDNDRPIESKDILRAHKLLYGAGFLMLIVCWLIVIMIGW